MKKIAFTIQVLALTIMVPALVVLEINHTTGKSIQHPAVITNTVKTDACKIAVPVIPLAENERLPHGIILEVLSY